MAFIAALGAMSVATAVVTQDAAQAKPVALKRVYKAGEKQAYVFDMTMGDGEGEFQMNGGFVTEVKKAEANGQAECVIETTKLKMKFAGEEQDAPELPKPLTLTFDQFGVPTKMDLGDEANPAIGALVVAYLPNKAVPLGGTFEIKWESSDGYKMEGTGKLIATGMLYEEHVAKIELDAKTTEKDGGEGKLKGTIYTNTDTGKLVKAEATAEFEFEGEKSTGKMVLAKVRQK